MNRYMNNFSVVILASANNPSILNPDFLKSQGIVDSSLTPVNVVCTPPVSQVTYKENISIVAEFEKLQFTDTLVERIPFKSPITAIATKYVETLPHVQYTSVGLNFTDHIKCKDRSSSLSILPEKFLKEGPWCTHGDSQPAIGLRFIYNIGDIRAAFTMDTAELNVKGSPAISIIQIAANYHFDSKNIEEIIEFISNWEKQYEHFSGFIADTFGEVINVT